MTTRISILLLLLFTPLLLVVSDAQALVLPGSSTFDASLDGWTKDPAQTTEIIHVATGGNPGGYIQNTDRGSTGGDIIAPAAYTGDWSALNGTGLLSWDFNLFDLGGSPGVITDLRAMISGPGGSATFFSGISPVVGTWINVTAPVAQAAWSLQSGGWAALLTDVTELRLEIEPVFSGALPGEVAGIDNVSLTAVPSPSSFILCGPLLAWLLAQRRAWRPSSALQA